MQSMVLSQTKIGEEGDTFVQLYTFQSVINILVLLNEKYLLEVGVKRIKKPGLS